MSRHPLDSREGRAYLLFGLPPIERAFFEHVLHCEGCRLSLARALTEYQAAGAETHRVGVPYSQAFDVVAEVLYGEEVAAKRAAASELLEELLRQPPAHWQAVVAGRLGDLAPALAVLLVDQVAQRTEESPATGESLAALARSVIREIDADTLPVLLRADLLACLQAWIGYAHALRQDWKRAEEAFNEVGKFLADQPETSAEALYCRLLGQTQEQRGRIPEALALYGRAAELAGRFGATDEELLALVRIARIHETRGDSERAGAVAASGLVHAALARKEASIVDELRECFDAALLGPPAVDYLDLLRVLVSASSEGGERQVQAILKRALESPSPIAVLAAVNLALRYSRANRLADLRDLADAVSRIIPGPGPGVARGAVGKLLEILQDPGASIDAIEQAAEAAAQAIRGRDAKAMKTADLLHH